MYKYSNILIHTTSSLRLSLQHVITIASNSLSSWSEVTKNSCIESSSNFIKGHAVRSLHVLRNMEWITAPFRPHISQQKNLAIYSNVSIFSWYLFFIFARARAYAYSKGSFLPLIIVFCLFVCMNGNILPSYFCHLMYWSKKCNFLLLLCKN